MSKEKTNTYTQCLLRKNIEGCEHMRATWLPTIYAVKDYILEIKNKANQEWEDGWKVSEVWATMDASYIEENERNYLIQRKASDI